VVKAYSEDEAIQIAKEISVAPCEDDDGAI